MNTNLFDTAKVHLLLLSCGTNACFHIAKILKQKFDGLFYIVGCDINKRWLIPTSKYLDNFYQSPFSSEDGYYSFVINVCKQEKINWILPSFDGDQFLFSSDNKDLQILGINSFAISSSLSFYCNKELTNNYLESIGIPVPKSFSRNEVDDDTEYFVKPINGVGSIGVDIKFGKEIKNNVNFEGVIQELCFEPEYTLECFFYNKIVYSIVRERIASKSGVCTKTRITTNTNLELYAKKLAENTQLPYIFNMQFMKNRLNDFVCTDLNLRAAGGMSLSYAAGWDEVSSIANIMLGNDEKTIIASVNNPIIEQYVIRHFEDVVTKKVRERIAFDLDGTLLDSRRRHKVVMSDVLKKYGYVIDTSNLVTFKSNGKNNIEWLLSLGIEIEQAKKINSEWISLIEDIDYLNLDVLYPNIIEVLSRLCVDNELYIITARTNKINAINQIKGLGIAKFFTDIIVVDSCRQAFLLKSNELTKNKIDYFIGDTESDYQAAKIANCKFSAVSYGFRSEAFLKTFLKDVCPNLQSLFVY